MPDTWNFPRLLSILLLPCAIGSARAADTTVTLTPTQDASIYHGTPGSEALSDGMGTHLWLGVTAFGLNHRSLLKFDLASVPPGSVVKQATLTVWESKSQNTYEVALHRILAAWTEGSANSGSTGSGAPASHGDVTWTHRSYPGTLWATPGGDIQTQASTVQSVGVADSYYSWSATSTGSVIPRLIQDVQSWVNQPASNFGWMMIGDETNLQSAKRFESRNYPFSNRQPQLVVTYGDPVVALASDADAPLPLWALLALGVGLLGQSTPLSLRRLWK